MGLLLNNTAEIQVLEQQTRMLDAKFEYEKKKNLPDLTLELFNSFNLEAYQPGFQVGIKLPFFNQQYNAQYKSIELGKNAIEREMQNLNLMLNAEHQQLLNTLEKHNQALQYYEEEGMTLADEIVTTAEKSFLYGEIDFFQYIQSLENAYQIKIDYLDQLNALNQTIINLNYLTL